MDSHEGFATGACIKTPYTELRNVNRSLVTQLDLRNANLVIYSIQTHLSRIVVLRECARISAEEVSSCPENSWSYVKLFNYKSRMIVKKINIEGSGLPFEIHRQSTSVSAMR